MKKMKYVLTEEASTLLYLFAVSKNVGLPKGAVSDKAILARPVIATS